MLIKNIAEVFTFKLDEEDEEKLALARKGMKAFAGLNGRITTLKATENYKYLTLREAALRYHGFIDTNIPPFLVKAIKVLKNAAEKGGEKLTEEKDDEE